MFRFTIRDLLWLTVGVAWWVDRNRLAERLRPFAAWEEVLNGLDLGPVETDTLSHSR